VLDWARGGLQKPSRFLPFRRPGIGVIWRLPIPAQDGRTEAEKLMAEAPALDPDRRGPFQFALAFAGLGDRDRTLEQLERLARVGPVRMGFTLNSPEFAFLRGDPRVKALRNRLGLPE